MCFGDWVKTWGAFGAFGVAVGVGDHGIDTDVEGMVSWEVKICR